MVTVSTPPNNAHPAGPGNYFKLKGSGATNPEWVLVSHLVKSPNTPSLLQEEIEVYIDSPGAARAQFGERGEPKSTFITVNLEGIGGTEPDCDSDDDCKTCKKCEVCKDPSGSETPDNQTCSSPKSTYKGPGSCGNSIDVDKDFQVTLSVNGMRIRTLGGELSLSFFRVNGTDAPLAEGVPMGSGGGRVSHLGAYRQAYFDPDPVNPRFALVNGFDGSQRAYYFSYNAGADAVWKPGPGLCDELLRKANGHWRETTCDRTYFDYDSYGRLYRKAKLNAGEVYFHYDPSNKVQRLSGDFPGEVYFTFDGNGNLSRVTQRDTSGPSYREWEYEYTNVSGAGQTLTKITGPEGCVTHMGYNSRGEVTKETDPLNYTTYYEYTYFANTGWRISKVIPPAGTPTLFVHDGPNYSLRKHVEEPPLTTYYVRDTGLNRIAQSILGTGTTPQLWGFDTPNTDNTSTLDRLSRPSYFGYDGTHNKTRELDPLRNSAYFAYNADNRMTRSVGKRWPETGSLKDFTTYYEHDNDGNVVKTIDPLENTEIMSYGRGGVMLHKRDARGKLSYFGFDEYGRQTRTLDAVQASSYFGYDIYGNQTRSVSPRWPEAGFAAFTSYFEYDLQDRLVRSVDAEGDVTETDYSARCGEGPIAQYQLVENAWRASYFVFDGIQRLVRSIDPLGQSTTSSYVGETGLTAKQGDKRGFGTYYAYDGEQRQVKMLDALLNSSYFHYDAVGNQVRSVAPRWKESGSFYALTSYFGFDELNRQVRTLDPLQNSTYFGFDAAGNRVRSVGPRWKESNFGNFTTYYAFDRLNRQASMIDTLGNTSRSGYDEASNLIRQQDPRGNTTYFGFDPVNRQNAIVDPAGESSYFGYDAAGNQTRMVGPRWKESSFAGFSTYFEFDRVNRQSAVIDALNQKVYFAYDAAGNRRLQYDHITASSFALTYFGFDKLDRLVKTVDAQSRVSYFEFDPNGNQTTAILPGSPAQVTRSGYDKLNRLEATDSPFGASSYFFYDEASNLVRQVAPRWTEVNGFTGFVSYFGFDALNRRVRSQDALGNSAYFGFDAAGNQTRSVGPRWKESTQAAFSTYFEFDRLERLNKTIDAQGSAFERFYDAVGNLTVLKPPTGGASYFAYDNRNLLTTSVDGAFNVSYFAHDAGANRARAVSPRSFLTYFGYDALNRLARVLDAESGTAYFGYDIGGNTARVVDALARTTYFDYDKLDRLTRSIAANDTTVEFFYDEAGNRNVEIDQLARSTYYFFDVGNRLARERDPLGRTAYFGYDNGSNLARTILRDGQVNYFGYDNLSRRTRIQYGRGTGYGQGAYGEDPYGDPFGSVVHYFDYDAAGNLIRTKDSWGTSYFAFDTLDRLSRRATPRPDAVYYGYDQVSNLTRLQYPQGLATAYFGYDTAQRLLKLRAPSGQSCYYLYDASSNVTRKHFGNLSACYYTFDKVERVTSIRHATSAGAPIAYFDFNRDVAGRILRIARENDLAVYYAFDSVDRLTSEVWRRPSDNVQIYGFFYDYDGANNRVKMRREFAAGAEWDSAYFAYANDNSLTQRRVQTPPSTFASTYYEYDNNGSMTKAWETPSTTTYFEYGVNQLVSRIVPPAGNPWSFLYDARLNRHLIDQGGTPVYYLWDAGLNQLEERLSDGSLRARYTHGAYRQFGIGSVVEVERVANSTTYFQYLHMDHRGTVYKVTDTNQDTQLAYTQDAFGSQLAPIGGANPTVPNSLIYQTNWLTFEIGGKRFGVSRNRIVDMELGIFLQRDFLPISNRYRAFENNPVALVDIDGLETKEELIRKIQKLLRENVLLARKIEELRSAAQKDKEQVPESLIGDLAFRALIEEYQRQIRENEQLIQYYSRELEELEREEARKRANQDPRLRALQEELKVLNDPLYRPPDFSVPPVPPIPPPQKPPKWSKQATAELARARAIINTTYQKNIAAGWTRGRIGNFIWSFSTGGTKGSCQEWAESFARALQREHDARPFTCIKWSAIGRYRLDFAFYHVALDICQDFPGEDEFVTNGVVFDGWQNVKDTSKCPEYYPPSTWAAGALPDGNPACKKKDFAPAPDPGPTPGSGSSSEALQE